MTAELEAGAVDRVARFVRDVEPLFAREMPVSFDPVQMTFLQKLVREATLKQGVNVEKADFFKAVVALDYFMDVVAARSTLLDDVKVIVEELEKMHELLDPDLELLIRYTGHFVNKDLKGAKHFKARDPIAKRHEKTNALAAGEATPDLFDRAVARMVCDLVVTEEARRLLGGFRGRNDLRAIVLVDAVLAVLPREAVGAPAGEALARGDVFAAACECLLALAASCATWSIREHVERRRARLAGGTT